METLFHPESGVAVLGMQLFPGTVLRETDVYASSFGAWEPCPRKGLCLERGCKTIWVRPSADLSKEAKQLLEYLVRSKFLLTYQGHWKVIPARGWKQDGRMDWEVLHPECVQPLIDFGFLVEHRFDHEVYEPSESARSITKRFDWNLR